MCEKVQGYPHGEIPQRRKTLLRGGSARDSPDQFPPIQEKWPESARNAGRIPLGRVAGFTSEQWPVWPRNGGRIGSEYTNILSGSLSLTFYDDETDGKWWQVSTFELGIGVGEDWTIDFGEVDTGIYTYSLNIAYLGDGSYSGKVMSLWGDFRIDQSVLTITYDPVPDNGNTHAVPEPSTILLLGSGLLGVAVLGRKRSK